MNDSRSGSELIELLSEVSLDLYQFTPMGYAMSRFAAPPSDLLMQIANDPSVENFKNSFSNVRESAIRYCNLAGEDFFQFEKILDFGCGVGRFIFAFDEYAGANQKFYGCDLNAACANWSKNNISFAEIERSNFLPPLPYQDNTFDYINAVSVFTHLTLDMQIAWAEEIHRVLKPGGIIAFTTNGLPYMPFLLDLSKTIFPVHDLRTIGSGDVFGALSEADSEDLEGQRGVVTFHSRGAIESFFYPLELRYYEPISTLAGGQAIAVLKKTSNSKIISPTAHDDKVGSFAFPAQPFSSELRVFLNFAGHAYYAQDQKLDFAVVAPNRPVVVSSASLNSSRIFADTHLIPVNFSIGAQSQAFRVEMALQPSSNLPAMNFHYPRLISRN